MCPWPRGGLKKISRLAIARHILRPPHKLCYISTTDPNPGLGLPLNRVRVRVVAGVNPNPNPDTATMRNLPPNSAADFLIFLTQKFSHSEICCRPAVSRSTFSSSSAHPQRNATNDEPTVSFCFGRRLSASGQDRQQTLHTCYFWQAASAGVQSTVPAHSKCAYAA